MPSKLYPLALHDALPILAANGYRVIAPYLRGFGSTRFLSPETARNGEQAVLAVDAVALMDALDVERAVVAGFDWGARTANVLRSEEHTSELQSQFHLVCPRSSTLLPYTTLFRSWQRTATA